MGKEVPLEYSYIVMHLSGAWSEIDNPEVARIWSERSWIPTPHLYDGGEMMMGGGQIRRAYED